MKVICKKQGSMTVHGTFSELQEESTRLIDQGVRDITWHNLTQMKDGSYQVTFFSAVYNMTSQEAVPPVK